MAEKFLLKKLTNGKRSTSVTTFLQKQTRSHEDIDILIRRDDQYGLQDHLVDWELWVADPPGALRPWKKGKFLPKGVQDIWGRKTSKDPWQIQIMLFDTESNDWIFKRDESIRRSVASITISATAINAATGSTALESSTNSSVVLPILAPEIQLLYKSKSIRPKDQQDFRNTVEALLQDQKRWLKDALMHIYTEGHDWLDQL